MDGIKKVFFSSLAVIGLIAGAGMTIQQKNQNYQSQQSIEEVREGVNICFARLQQTYTSVYISPNLSYLALDFLKTTESCFAQALSVAINAGLENSTKTEKLINRLGNYVRLFHAGVKNKSLFSKGKNDFSVANSRFVKLEETRDEIFESLDQLTYEAAQFERNINAILYALGAGAIVGLFGIVYFDRKAHFRFAKYRGQIDALITAENEKERDYSQAFYKAMKFFSVSVPQEASPELIKEAIIKGQVQAKELARPEQIINAVENYTEGSTEGSTERSTERSTKKSTKNKQEIELQATSKAQGHQATQSQATQNNREEQSVEPQIRVTLGDVLGQILMEYSPDILSQKISTKFNEYEEIDLKGNSTRLYHLMKFVFGILVKSEFQGNPYIHLTVEKKTTPIIHIKTNSIFSHFESSKSQSLFARATESFSDEFDLSIGEGADGVNTISIKQKKRLVDVFKGTKKQFMESRGISL